MLPAGAVCTLRGQCKQRGTPRGASNGPDPCLPATIRLYSEGRPETNSGVPANPSDLTVQKREVATTFFCYFGDATPNSSPSIHASSFKLADYTVMGGGSVTPFSF